jgi:hypothetical protein
MKKALTFLCVIITMQCYAQTKTDSIRVSDKTLDVFLDCTYCDLDYLRTEISGINYVRDRKEADVDIVASSIQTGGGGQKFTFVFIGQGKFKGERDTLRTTTTSFVTDDIQRKTITHILELGLIRYMAQTPFADKINITFTKDTAKNSMDVNVNPAIDKWKSWVFNTTIGGNVNKQQLAQQIVVNPGLSISKITPDWKVNLNYQLAYLNFAFNVGDSIIKANLFAQSFIGSYVKSLGEHVSAGMASSINESTQNNYAFQTKLGPEFEYSIFPYAESTHRQLRFIYAVYGVDNHYMDTTIYGKIHQTLGAEALTAYTQYKQKWGSLTAQLTGANYFYDPSKYEVNLSLSLSINLFEGFSINLNSSANLIHDQIFLPAAGPSETDILFGLQTLATTYQFQTGIQITYTFGSIYNNIVNPRCVLLFPYN